MRLRALLDTDALGLTLLGGEDELDRTVRGVMTTDLRDPSRYLSGGELVLTGLAWRREPGDSESFVRLLAGAGVAALGAGEAELGNIPDDLVAACARHRLPLFAVHESVAFASITEHVVRQVSGERAGDLAAVVDRHRRMMTSGPGAVAPTWSWICSARISTWAPGSSPPPDGSSRARRSPAPPRPLTCARRWPPST